MASSLGRAVAGDVIVGIRPEDIYEAEPASGAAAAAHLPARVAAVEPLGAETLLVVALDASGEELIARTGRDTTIRSGDRLDLAIDAGAIHLFDSTTTKAFV
jgi:multiple sugar transport system ATP-binding protein